MLSDRQEKLINIIIDEYIKTAEPVSSKALVKSRFFDLSSATLRNEMHDLETRGYLAQMHTSGGRVPTDKGYRFYVDNLIDSDDFSIQSNWQKKVDATLAVVSRDPRDINKTLAQLLSDLSDNIVIAGISEQDDFYKTGLASLFELPEFQEINKVFRLTSFFDEFDRMFGQIEREFFGGFNNNQDDINPHTKRESSLLAKDSLNSRSGVRVNVFIGRENHHPGIKDETVMTARYN